MNIEEILHNELTEDQYNTVIDNHPEVLSLLAPVPVNQEHWLSEYLD